MLNSFLKLQRPFVIFDPTLSEHRELFYKFERTQSWVGCPYQWAIDDDSLDVVHHIRKKMLDFYMKNEFVVEKPQKQSKNVLKIKHLQAQKLEKNG